MLCVILSLTSAQEYNRAAYMARVRRNRSGAEIVQLYIRDMKSSLSRPLKELKDFKKVVIAPGQTVEVEFEITPDDLMYFDADRHEWVAEAGDFKVLIGASSSDIRATVDFNLSDSVSAPIP